MPSVICQTCGATMAETPSGSFCPACVADACIDDLGTGTGASLAAAADADYALPRAFGDYELLSELGHGGMGLVFKARQRRLDRIVALKMLLTGRFSNRMARERFQREAESAARLQHPNIVAIHEVGEIDGHPFLTMDLVDGKNLAELCAGRPLPARQAAEWLRDIARAVQAAHDAGVLHRDLKPSNILVGSDGRPRVTDFGLAQRSDDDASLTLSGQVLGSPNYASPEQVAARHDQIDARSDVYGLGAVLFHLGTGHAPFSGSGAAETLRRVLAEEPVSPRRLNPALPRELEIITLKCLQKEPAQRYASAAELADDLENFLQHRPLRARPHSRAYAARKFVQRNKLPVGAAAGVMVAVAAALAFSATFWSREHTANRRKQAVHVQADKLMNLLLRDVRPSLEQFGRVAELDRFAEETVRYFAELPPELQDATYAGNRAVAQSMLAWVRWRGGDFNGAAQAATEVLTWRQRVLDESPDEFRRIAPLMRDVISLRNGGGSSVAAMKDRPRAEANVRRLRELIAQHPDDLFLTKELAIELIGLAALVANPDRDPAAGRAELTEAKDLMRRVLVGAPDNPFLRVIFADAVLDLGLVYKLCGDYARSIAESEEAAACLETASATRPGNLLLLEHLAQAEHALANQWSALSLARARDVEFAARKHFQALSVADPDHAIWRDMFACSHTVNAWYLFNNGNLAEAREALATVKATCASIPASHSWANPMLLPWKFIDDGRAAAGLGELDTARALADEARARFEKVVASRPAGSPGRTRNRVSALLGEAVLFSTTGDWPRVETLALDAMTMADAYARDQKLERLPLLDRGEARRLLGLARLRQGRAAEAAAVLRESVALLGGALPIMHPFDSRELRLAAARDALGEALIALGDAGEARRVLEEGLAFREADLARQPELAAAQVAFANTAALCASALDPSDSESVARRRNLLTRSTGAIARPTAENRLTRDQQQLVAWIATLARAAK